MCMVWFSSLVVPYVPVYVLMPAMNTVMALSALSPTLASPHGTDTAPKVSSLDGDKKDKVQCGRLQICLSLPSSLSPMLAAAILYLWGCVHWLTAVVMAVSLLLMALMWSPGIMHKTFSVGGDVTHNCRRLTLVYTFIKIMSIMGFVLVDLVAFSPVNQTIVETLLGFCSTFKNVWNWSLLVPLLINIVAGPFSHGVVYLSTAVCQPVVGMLIPSILSTVTSIALCVGFLGPFVYHLDELEDFGDLTPVLISGGALACGWALSYVFRACDALQKPSFLFMPYEDLFLSYGWCPGFSDQRRLLSFCADGVTRDNVLGQPVETTKSRVYVCTTVYREADYEMERLLLSIKKLSGSESLLGVHLESHIFMDNGINDTKLGEFAEQMVGLLVNRIGMNPGEARCLLTPYGLQLTCVLPGGMPLFVHFKDPDKVKPKKRWSQCMYINYIMNFRKALWGRDSDNDSLTVGRKNDCDVYFIGNECPSKVPDIAALPQSSRKLNGVGYPTLLNFTTQFQQSEQQVCTPNGGECNFSNGVCSGDSSSGEGGATQVQTATDHHSNASPCSESQPDHQGARCQSAGSTREREQNRQTPDVFHFDPEEEVDDDHTYILATDADMDFEPEAIADLLHMCNDDKRLGAACGRTHPIGKHTSSIVYHQIFEYAKDFWMIKSAQNVIGSVMCCPGCFSLYRATALRHVMAAYATPTTTPFTVYVKDTGEDRWMATLMMIQGWRLRYSAFADNTTYCPDTFEEFFKQRRRWILSDVANLILVVRNMPRLLRNNECFSLVYVLYLLNMFMNNVITPGTAIVMITAGMELVFRVPYVYTTPPLALTVYGYAFFCTHYSTRAQTLVTTVLTLLLGTIFASVALWGSYMIVDGMIGQINQGNFQFQQHYIILLLTLSLLYAALIHPKETYQTVYGLAYLLIFPAMHLLLPIYSIANIIDQSWGTRDSQSAQIPKLRCIPSLKRLLKRKNKSKQVATPEEDNLNIQSMVSALTQSMAEGSAQEQAENAFWENLNHTLLGNDVNVGLERAELASRLEQLRNRCLIGLLSINALWLALLSYFYVGIDSPLSRLNLYGLISGALYGFTLIIQVIGMTVSRVNHILIKMGRYLYGDKVPMWVSPSDRNPNCDKEWS